MDGEHPDTLIPLSRDELMHHLVIALAVIRPPIQVGRGRKLPHESEEQRAYAAELLVRHFELSGFRVFRGPGARAHGAGWGARER